MVLSVARVLAKVEKRKKPSSTVEKQNVFAFVEVVVVRFLNGSWRTNVYPDFYLCRSLN